MGQGTESCGGYEVDCDEYDGDNLSDGIWIQQNGVPISVQHMSTGHLRNAMRHCQKLARHSTFSCDQDKWDEWVNIFSRELDRREALIPTKTPAKVSPPAIVRGAKIWMVCHCGTEYPARKADLKRGYGYSCSKSCAAIRRDHGRPAAKPRDGG